MDIKIEGRGKVSKHSPTEKRRKEGREEGRERERERKKERKKEGRKERERERKEGRRGQGWERARRGEERKGKKNSS